MQDDSSVFPNFSRVLSSKDEELLGCSDVAMVGSHGLTAPVVCALIVARPRSSLCFTRVVSANT